MTLNLALLSVLLSGLLVGGMGGVGIYYYVTTTPPAWQSQIMSHITLTSTVASISNVAFLYQGDYLWNNSTTKVGMWSAMIDAEASGVTVTNMRLMTLDVADIAGGTYKVRVYFLYNPSGFTLKYDDTTVNTPTAFTIQLEIDANFNLLTYNAYTLHSVVDYGEPRKC